MSGGWRSAWPKRRTEMVFSKVNLSFGEILLRSRVEVKIGFLEIAFDAKSVAVHNPETVVRLSISL